MPSALSLRMNNLVSKLFGLCYDSWIASLSPHLSPCLDMVFVHCLLPAFWKQLANSLAMFYSRLKDQALLRIHLSFYSTQHVLVGPPLVIQSILHSVFVEIQCKIVKNKWNPVEANWVIMTSGRSILCPPWEGTAMQREMYLSSKQV